MNLLNNSLEIKGSKPIPLSTSEILYFPSIFFKLTIIELPADENFIELSIKFVSI